MKRLLTLLISLALICLGLTVSAATFDDIYGHWGVNAIESMAKRGVVSGYPDGAFHPDAPVSRAEFAKMITALYGLGVTDNGWIAFEDTEPDAWYAPYAPAFRVLVSEPLKAACEEYGYPAGWNADRFDRLDPQSPLTRIEAAQAIRMVIGLDGAELDERFMELADKNADAPDFIDNRGIAALVGGMMYHGLMTGDSGYRFRPFDSISRAEVCTILNRTVNKYRLSNVNDRILAMVRAVDALAAQAGDFLSESKMTPADKETAAVIGGETVSRADWELIYRVTAIDLGLKNDASGTTGPARGQTAEAAEVEAELLARLKVTVATRLKCREYGLDNPRERLSAALSRETAVSFLGTEDGYAFDKYLLDISMSARLAEMLAENGGPCAVGDEEISQYMHDNAGVDENMARAALVNERFIALAAQWANELEVTVTGGPVTARA